MSIPHNIIHLLIIGLTLFPLGIAGQTADSLIVSQLKAKNVTFSNDNSVTLLMNGQEKFDDMFTAIRQAKSSIPLE